MVPDWSREPATSWSAVGHTSDWATEPILSLRLIMKSFVRSFAAFRWFKKASISYLRKKCALSTDWFKPAQEKCGSVHWPSRLDHSCWPWTLSNSTTTSSVSNAVVSTLPHLTSSHPNGNHADGAYPESERDCLSKYQGNAIFLWNKRNPVILAVYLAAQMRY